MPERKIRVMVSSSVYGQEEFLEQIFAVLTGYGYEVWMSMKGTIPTNPRLSNFENCLAAARDSDVFLGIINGVYGSGRKGDDLSITHQEIKRAVELGKIRWFLVHHHVITARALLQQFRFDAERNRLPIKFRATKVLDDIRILDMYDDAIQDNVPLADRRGNWAQQYTSTADALAFIQTQFNSTARIGDFLLERHQVDKT